jgi:hypothetical protein
MFRHVRRSPSGAKKQVRLASSMSMTPLPNSTQDLPVAAYLNSEFMANYRSNGQPVRIQASDDIRLNEVQIQ